MLDYLKELLQDFNSNNENNFEIGIKNKEQKKLALETAIEILEKVKNNERSVLNGNIK